MDRDERLDRLRQTLDDYEDPTQALADLVRMVDCAGGIREASQGYTVPGEIDRQFLAEIYIRACEILDLPKKEADFVGKSDVALEVRPEPALGAEEGAASRDDREDEQAG